MRAGRDRTAPHIANEGLRDAAKQSQFYGTFGRPILKVFLMAVFTYQIAYYFWVKLEQDEIKGEMQSTISELEERIHQLEKVQK
ncbi:hypothetical protein F4780DRAFT_775747 [Xylariomycetidae sp. FL0641]|nr:hypothetical protein F4780DRAFT_775747 [Xylariomycetidae sp. FL0641]